MHGDNGMVIKLVCIKVSIWRFKKAGGQVNAMIHAAGMKYLLLSIFFAHFLVIFSGAVQHVYTSMTHECGSFCFLHSPNEN